MVHFLDYIHTHIIQRLDASNLGFTSLAANHLSQFTDLFAIFGRQNLLHI